MSGAPASIKPGTRVGHYVVDRCIGSGGMAEVYEATHTELNKRVALKVIRRDAASDERTLNRFLLEGKAAARVRHQNLVDVTDVGVIDGLPCLVMEYLEGESLRSYLEREAPLSVSQAVGIIIPIVAGVAAAHDSGVIHRDLKPSNIHLVTQGGELQPKVLDFGISKLLHEPTEMALTAESVFVGSPLYVSPEVARGEKHLDGRVDQYSVGVLLYEAVCGCRPFSAEDDNFIALLRAIGDGTFNPPSIHRPDLPREFEMIILRAMATDPIERYPSLRSFGSALLPFASKRTKMIWTPQLLGRAPGEGETATYTGGDQRETMPHSNSPTLIDLKNAFAPTVLDGPVDSSGPRSGMVSGEVRVSSPPSAAARMEPSERGVGTLTRAGSEIQTWTERPKRRRGLLWAAILLAVVPVLGLGIFIGLRASSEVSGAAASAPTVPAAAETSSPSAAREPESVPAETDAGASEVTTVDQLPTEEGVEPAPRPRAPAPRAAGKPKPKPAAEPEPAEAAPSPEPEVSKPARPKIRTDNRDPWEK